MPLYDYRCPDGHAFERLVPISAGAVQECPGCGAASPKVPSRVSLSGRASPGLSREQMPQTWKGTGGADREYVGRLRRQWDRRQRLEEKYPELAGDQRPVLAHEGRYHDAPLRAGDAGTPVGPGAHDRAVSGAGTGADTSASAGSPASSVTDGSRP